MCAMDKISKEKRSWLMSKIKSKNTKPEIMVRSLLHGLGYRFRLKSSCLPCKPDIILPKYKTVFFIHGCFWHQHKGCPAKGKLPSTNVPYWKEKFRRNIARDRKNNAMVKKLGWSAVVIWECELNDKRKITSRILKICQPRGGSS